MDMHKELNDEACQILVFLEHNECSLDELINKRSGGIYSATTLLRLVKEGYVRRFKRRKFNDKFYYRLTDKGQEAVDDMEC